MEIKKLIWSPLALASWTKVDATMTTMDMATIDTMYLVIFWTEIVWRLKKNLALLKWAPLFIPFHLLLSRLIVVTNIARAGQQSADYSLGAQNRLFIEYTGTRK